jgi:hypothetical protein
VILANQAITVLLQSDEGRPLLIEVVVVEIGARDDLPRTNDINIYE